MVEKTPGQVNYEAHFHALYDTVPTSSDVWTWQTPHVQSAWEAAAQAVRAMVTLGYHADHQHEEPDHA